MREAKLRPKNLKERNFVYLDDVFTAVFVVVA